MALYHTAHTIARRMRLTQPIRPFTKQKSLGVGLCGRQHIKSWKSLKLLGSQHESRLHHVGGGQEGEVPHTPYKEESDSEEEEEEIAAVEMILETYFMHCDNTYNKLQTLCECLARPNCHRISYFCLHGGSTRGCRLDCKAKFNS